MKQAIIEFLTALLNLLLPILFWYLLIDTSTNFIFFSYQPSNFKCLIIILLSLLLINNCNNGEKR